MHNKTETCFSIQAFTADNDIRAKTRITVDLCSSANFWGGLLKCSAAPKIPMKFVTTRTLPAGGPLVKLRES